MGRGAAAPIPYNPIPCRSCPRSRSCVAAWSRASRGGASSGSKSASGRCGSRSSRGSSRAGSPAAGSWLSGGAASTSDHVEGGSTLAVHLGMSGRLTLAPATTPKEPHEHLALWLDGGERLRLRDPRRFGTAFARATAELDRDPHFAHLGREPLDPPVTGGELAGLAAGRRAPVKSFLMDRGGSSASATFTRARRSSALACARPRGRPDRTHGVGAARRRSRRGARAGDRRGRTTLNDFRDGAGNAGLSRSRSRSTGETASPAFAAAHGSEVVACGASSFCCLRCQRSGRAPATGSRRIVRP